MRVSFIRDFTIVQPLGTEAVSIVERLFLGKCPLSEIYCAFQSSLKHLKLIDL